jgi:hypothetical protein
MTTDWMVAIRYQGGSVDHWGAYDAGPRLTGDRSPQPESIDDTLGETGFDEWNEEL